VIGSHYYVPQGMDRQFGRIARLPPVLCAHRRTGFTTVVQAACLHSRRWKRAQESRRAGRPPPGYALEAKLERLLEPGGNAETIARAAAVTEAVATDDLGCGQNLDIVRGMPRTGRNDHIDLDRGADLRPRRLFRHVQFEEHPARADVTRAGAKGLDDSRHSAFER